MNTAYLKNIILASMLAYSSTAGAAIIITTGNGNQNVDNVLFNDGSLIHSGTYVQGNFNGSGAGFICGFTSGSGNFQIQGGGGQATISGLPGNDPYKSLSFALEAGATFTKAVINPNATVSGHINFTVDYVNTLGTFSQSMNLDGHGQNFFTINADNGFKITKVTFATTDSAFSNASQFRLGGFAAASTPGRVPDGGTTLALFGISLLGLHSARRKFAKR